MIKINNKKNNKNALKHGMSHDLFYSRYNQAKYRCENPNNKDYSHYGGRGIKFLWKSFEEFTKDMYSTYGKKMTLERINVNGDYCRENCKWATRKEQARNRTNRRIVKFLGQEKCISEWAEFLGIKRYNINNRLNRGWSIKTALTKDIWS